MKEMETGGRREIVDTFPASARTFSRCRVVRPAYSCQSESCSLGAHGSPQLPREGAGGKFSPAEKQVHRWPTLHRAHGISMEDFAWTSTSLALGDDALPPALANFSLMRSCSRVWCKRGCRCARISCLPAGARSSGGCMVAVADRRDKRRSCTIIVR